MEYCKTGVVQFVVSGRKALFVILWYSLCSCFKGEGIVCDTCVNVSGRRHYV